MSLKVSVDMTHLQWIFILAIISINFIALNANAKPLSDAEVSSGKASVSYKKIKQTYQIIVEFAVQNSENQ
jgi:hypothetical protein